MYAILLRATTIAFLAVAKLGSLLERSIEIGTGAVFAIRGKWDRKLR